MELERPSVAKAITISWVTGSVASLNDVLVKGMQMHGLALELIAQRALQFDVGSEPIRQGA
jgi:hypothetical protein